MDKLFGSAKKKLPVSKNDSELVPVMYLEFDGGLHREIRIFRCEVFIVLSGMIQISYDRFIAEKVSEGNFLLLPPGSRCSFTMDEKVKILHLRVENIEQISSEISPGMLSKMKNGTYADFPILPLNRPLGKYVDFLLKILADNVDNIHLFRLKVHEFFFLLKAYYTKEQVESFLSSLYKPDSAFAMFVLNNYRYVKTVYEFARLCNCSLSSFDKHFKQVFGISAYKWMMQKKKDYIYYQLKTTNKPLKQVAEETGFSSQPQFTDFCKKHLGASPGVLRKNNIA